MHGYSGTGRRHLRSVGEYGLRSGVPEHERGRHLQCGGRHPAVRFLQSIPERSAQKLTQPANPNGGGTTNAPVSTVTTDPPGLQVTVDTVAATAPATYDWNLADFHVIDAEPQTSPDGGTNYVFSSWSDGGAQSHTVQATFWATYNASLPRRNTC